MVSIADEIVRIRRELAVSDAFVIGQFEGGVHYFDTIKTMSDVREAEVTAEKHPPDLAVGAFLECRSLQIILESAEFDLGMLDNFLIRLNNVKKKDCFPEFKNTPPPELHQLAQKVVNYIEKNKKNVNLIVQAIEKTSEKRFPKGQAKEYVRCSLNIILYEQMLDSFISNASDEKSLEDGFIMLKRLKDFRIFDPDMLDVFDTLTLKEPLERNQEARILLNPLRGVYVENPEEGSTLMISEKRELQLDAQPLFVSKIDESSSTYVYKAVAHKTKQVIVKLYRSTSEDFIKKIEKEREFLKELANKKPNFLEYYGSYIEQNQNSYEIGIVMELCARSLKDELEERRQSGRNFTIQELIKHITEILECFKYMEEHKIIHFDVKADNIFVTADGQLKIGDFNTTKYLDISEDNSTFFNHEYIDFGTANYYPPEIQDAIDSHQDVRYKPRKVDVYSLGMTFLQMWFLKPLYGYNTTDKKNELESQIEQIEVGWIRQIIKKMMSYQPNKRPKFKKLIGMIDREGTVLDN